MRGRLSRLWPLAALGGFLALGCEKAAVKPNYPPDPVLVGKHPVEGKTTTPTHLVVHQEPVSPVLPETAIATAPASLSNFARTTAAKPLSPAPPSADAAHTPAKPPVLAIPAVQTKPPADAPTRPPAPRPVAGTYGHAADYAWLQGVLDRHYLGHMDLRFCDASEEEEWGGKVSLAEDPRLKQFKDGDVLFVEGELVMENGQPKRGRTNRYPLYHVRNVELVHHKQ
jgi:hypothetical protein